MEGKLKRVSVVDVDMPFGSMVAFMIKWAIASIPALIGLGIIMGIALSLLGGIASVLSTF